jgi:hypothetical protein
MEVVVSVVSPEDGFLVVERVAVDGVVGGRLGGREGRKPVMAVANGRKITCLTFLPF